MTSIEVYLAPRKDMPGRVIMVAKDQETANALAVAIERLAHGLADVDGLSVYTRVRGALPEVEEPEPEPDPLDW